jgi:hypothetical protein
VDNLAPKNVITDVVESGELALTAVRPPVVSL